MVKESRIIEGCIQGDESAQRELFERFSPSLFGVCLRYTNTRVEAEDIFQEGFVSIFAKIEQYKGEGSFEGWMRRVMVTTALMYHRKIKGTNNTVEITDAAEGKYFEHTQDEKPEPDTKDIKAIIEDADFSREELLSISNKLSDGYRMVFNLVVIEGYKHKEAANILGIAESTSKTQLLKARKVLQKMLYEVALDKRRKKKPEGALALAFIVMEGDFNYIDKILKDGLGNLQVPPPTDWAGISGNVAEQAVANSAGTASSLSNSGLQNGTGIVAKVSTNVVKFVTSQLHTVGTMLVASTFSLGVFTQSTGPLLATSETFEQDIPATKEVIIQENVISEPEGNEPFLLTVSEELSQEKVAPKEIIVKNEIIKPIAKEATVIDTVRVPVKRKKVIKIKKKYIVKDTVKVEKRLNKRR